MARQGLGSDAKGGRLCVRAAVLPRPGASLEIEELTLVGPGRGEVLVRLDASGICRSDLHVAESGEGLRCPAVLGHEGAGVIEAVGDDVDIAPATRVVLSWVPRCGVCARCREGRPQLCARLSICPPGGSLLRGDSDPVGAYMGLGCLAELREHRSPRPVVVFT